MFFLLSTRNFPKLGKIYQFFLVHVLGVMGRKGKRPKARRRRAQAARKWEDEVDDEELQELLRQMFSQRAQQEGGAARGSWPMLDQIIALIALIMSQLQGLFPTNADRERRERASSPGSSSSSSSSSGGGSGSGSAGDEATAAAEDPFKVLLLTAEPPPTKREVKKAYQKQARIWHPDKNLDNLVEANAKMRNINAAYDRCNSILDGDNDDEFTLSGDSESDSDGGSASDDEASTGTTK